MAIVRHTLKTLPKVRKKDLARVDAIKDEEIDCSDIPEATASSNFRLYEMLKIKKLVKIKK